MDAYDFLIYVLPLLLFAIIGTVEGPFLICKIKNLLKQNSKHGVVLGWNTSGYINISVKDFNNSIGGWTIGKHAVILKEHVLGNKGGIPIAVVNLNDVKAKYSFRNEGSDVTGKTFDTLLQSAREIGLKEVMQNDKKITYIMYTVIAILVIALGIGYLVYTGNGDITKIGALAEGTYNTLNAVNASALNSTTQAGNLLILG